MEENHQEHPRRLRKDRYWLYLSMSGFLVFTAAIGFYVLHRGNTSPNGLPKNVISQISDFTPYYFSINAPPDGLLLKTGSASYSENVLIFSLSDAKGQTIALTEQKLPAEFADSKLQGDESFSTVSGKATLTNVQGGRITGSLITKDGTFVLLNTSAPIELNTIKDILRGLQAIR